MKSNKQYPDFMGIGSTRSGSSWLHYVLSDHPDVWISPVKELHYHDRPMHGQLSFLCDPSACKGRIKSYFDGEWNVNGDGWYRSLYWDLKFSLRPRSDHWYSSLFDDAGTRIAGEITPAYAILSRQQIEHLASKNRELQAIYLIRNPIERGWSSIVNGLAKKHGISIKNVSENRILSKIEQPGFLKRSNYAENIQRWRKVIGKDRLFIGFFEDIVSRPGELIDCLCKFLNVRGAELIASEKLRQPKNISKPYSATMPKNIEIYLTKKLYPMIKKTQQLLGGYTDKWLFDADKILKGST